MTDLILREWNGKTIRQREDGYISLTDMAHSSGKKINDWNKLESTRNYLVALETSERIPADVLVKTHIYGENNLRGTWGHRLIAIEFARWCSPEFSIQCNKWVEELLTTGLAVNTAKFNQEELDQLKSVVTNRNLRIRVLESQKKELEEQNTVLTQEHCYKSLVEAFVADNLMYKQGSYEHSNAVYERFRLWKDEYADQDIYSQLPALTKLTFLQELQRYFKGLGTPKDHRMHISPLPEHTDIENAKLVEEYQIGMGTLTVGTQLGE